MLLALLGPDELPPMGRDVTVLLSSRSMERLCRRWFGLNWNADTAGDKDTEEGREPSVGTPRVVDELPLLLPWISLVSSVFVVSGIGDGSTQCKSHTHSK